MTEGGVPSLNPQVVGRENGEFALLNVSLDEMDPLQRIGVALMIWDQTRLLMEAQGRYRARNPQISGASGVGTTDDIDREVAKLVGASRSSVGNIRPRALRQPEVVERMVAGKFASLKDVQRSLGMKVPISFYEGGKSQAKLKDSDFGRGDKFEYAIGALLQYSRVWRKKGFRYAHVNPKEAQKRVSLIDEAMADLAAAREELALRSHVATYRAPSERKKGEQ